MTAKPLRERVMENTKQKPQAQLRGQRTLTVSTLHRQWGEAHERLLRAEYPAKWKMARRPRLHAGSENPSHNEWLDHHNHRRGV
jgi:hypothetical protein